MKRTLASGVVLAMAVAAGGAAPLAQQSSAASAPVEAPNATKPAASAPAGGDQKDGSPMPPQGFTYKAEGRRDPFVVLLKRGSDVAGTTAAARAAGLAGLNTSEVTLRGILASQGTYVAMLLGSDEKTYIVRTGDKLADGTISSITPDAMVILQRLRDSLGQAKEREVRKLLRHVDGTN
ncbi:MAG TPA: pilus assembly protein PilP [Vicinamibacterales bacterium]|nr:pilus assembly protein PilP [Vicinamibacterales bacterium]